MNQKLINFFLSSNLVSPQKAEDIASHFKQRSLKKNEFLLKETHVCDEYFFLESGFMRSFAHDTEGNDITTNFYSSYQVVFEVSSFFHRIPTKENIQALTECEGWSITYNQLNALFHSMHEFRDFGRYILVRLLTALKSRTLSMITETAEQRYETLLKSNPEIFIHAPLKHIATYLGVTDSSLSRIRSQITQISQKS